MTAHILACGESGRHWPGQGFCIGVNDCWKFGKETSVLLVVNSLSQFPDRQKIVIDSRPKHGFYTNQPIFQSRPDYKNIGYMNHFNYKTRIEQGKLYKTGVSSPIIAVSLAWQMGFDKFVLWGVDFVNHDRIFGLKAQREVDNYVHFNRLLNKQGAGMYLGATETFTNTGALSGKIPNFRYVA